MLSQASNNPGRHPMKTSIKVSAMIIWKTRNRVMPSAMTIPISRVRSRMAISIVFTIPKESAIRIITINMVVNWSSVEMIRSVSGEMTFQDGKPAKDNFHTYRMIRHSEAPKKIEVHFVENQVDPTGLGEPLFPPIFAALANAMYQAKRKRFYTQPFLKEWEGSV